MTTAPEHGTPWSAKLSAPVLVGRESELAALTTALVRQPAVAMIEGEAGVGKSRLLRELLRERIVRPDLRPLRVMIGHCRSLREPFLYGAVLEALGGLHRPMSGPILPPGHSRLSPVTGVLRPLLPELSHYLPEPPEPVGDPRSERHRLFRAVRELLSAIGPALLVVEDLHWADDGSRHLLRFLMAAPPDELSIVVTYRREDIPGGVPLGSAYRPPPGTASVLVDLRPLDPAQVRTLTSAILGRRAISAEFAAKLYERTAGIPFVVEETLRALHHSTGAVQLNGPAARHLLENVDVPVLLREAMAERLADMPLPAVKLAHAAAVLDVPSEVELLREVAGLTEGRCHTALAAALGGGVLHETEDYRYGYRHPLARQAVYDTLPGFERRRLHVRALRALERRDPPPLVRLADHAHLAGDTALALRYGEPAADLAVQVGDASTATTLLQRLLREPALTDQDVDRLAIKLGEVAHTGLEQYDPAATLERLLGDHRLSTATRGEVRLFLGLLLIRQADGIQRGCSVIETALSELAERPDLLAKGVAVLAQPYLGVTPAKETRVWREWLRNLIETSDGELRLSLLANYLPSAAHSGDSSILGDLDDVLPSGPALPGERRQLSRLYCNLADACVGVGHYGRAQALLDDGLRVAADVGASFVVSTGRASQARLDWFLGNWQGLVGRATDLLDEYHDLMPVATELSLVLGLLAIARGDWEEAEIRLKATGADTPHDGIAPVVIAGMAALARLRLAQGDHVAAVAEAGHALAVIRTKENWVWAGELVPVAVEALLAGDRLDEARALTDEFERGLAGKDAPMAKAALEMAGGLIARAEGDPPAALRRHELARNGFHRLPAPYFEALAAEQAALCRLETGDSSSETGPEAASEAASEAVAQLSALAGRFAELGASRDADRCRHLLREHGTVTPSRRGRRGYGDVLSPREEDVARLLARGLTNREIAEVLFLSPRTVEQHVSRTLRKLGKRSRTELFAPETT
ncbi:ATP-binding protein [Sphaerimonospora thailandensis]|uniref:LuxR family transcriptional regulator n=1 Tax=Sphaerimonospora thailandensis TaxID=795644 RepID=A0A8J3RCC3_9ACTN|nr:LuxR family transcriptional regulator [Sphaerimonospora thailandensis]GIH73117.1 LuxR family transcriptional regulator [Sphaerimonospora thailandensis]